MGCREFCSKIRDNSFTIHAKFDASSRQKDRQNSRRVRIRDTHLQSTLKFVAGENSRQILSRKTVAKNFDFFRQNFRRFFRRFFLMSFTLFQTSRKIFRQNF